MLIDMKDFFLIDPDVVYLNHGSFGAVPKEVFTTYQKFQQELEKNPVRFLYRELSDEIMHVKEVLGHTLNSPADNLLIIPNATYGVNLVLRSLGIQPGEEILTSTHEYGACINALRYFTQSSGIHLIQQHVPLPLESPEIVIDQIWTGVTSQTKVLFISHITSPTALRFPVLQLCERARHKGILTIVDGAHAPGQIPLDLTDIGADFYIGNCHKWMLSPRGAGFLYASSEMIELLEPLIVSWGWNSTGISQENPASLENLQWTGTYDPAAFLSIPAAIEFQASQNWNQFRQNAQTIIKRFLIDFSSEFNTPMSYSPNAEPFIQMASAPLPPIRSSAGFQEELWKNHSIEIPCIEWRNQQFLRISYQAYNSEIDLEKLFYAAKHLLTSFQV